MKLSKILYWVCFILGALLCVLNMFVNNVAITISAIAVLVVAIIAYFVNSSLQKKNTSAPSESKKSAELKKQREDSYKRIREQKKAKKENKQN